MIDAGPVWKSHRKRSRSSGYRYKPRPVHCYDPKRLLLAGLIAVFIQAAMIAAWGQTAGRKPQVALAASHVTNRSATVPAHWPHLKYAIYFCYGELEKLLVDPATRRETLEYFAPVRPERFYLEASSKGDVDVALMKKVADAIRAEGIKVSGAIVPVVPDGPLCYNDPQQLAVVERRARAMAQVFDELILDDWLFTTCTCEKCVTGRGQSNWADYRTRLLLEKATKHIIEPARQVNPKVKLIIKYPNWYEGHRLNGYDVEAETHRFDGMAVGIETRTRAVQDQHIPIYSGYIFQKWWSGVEPAKWIGSWLDNYGMKGEDHDYVAQVWQAVLAQAPEIILWSGGNLHSTGPFSDVYPHFREMLPEFDRVAGMLSGSSRGVPVYLPYGSEGEYNIFGHLGMSGIPLTPVGQFPTDQQIAVFTKHSLKDPELADKLLARLRGGQDVFMTWGVFSSLQQTEFKHMLSLVDAGGSSISSSAFRVRDWNDETVVRSDRPFVFPSIATTTWPYVREVAMVREDYDFAVLMKIKYLNGNLYILNVPENSYDLLRLPEPVLNAIRRSVTKELGVQLMGPGGVALYPFGSAQYVLYNMRDEPARVALSFAKAVPTAGWQELAHGKSLAVTEIKARAAEKASTRSEVSLTLQPFEIAVVQAPPE
jgi:hypothetical protein